MNIYRLSGFNQRLFYLWYNALERDSHARVDRQAVHSAQLAEDGLVTLPRLFDPAHEEFKEFVEFARRETTIAMEKLEQRPSADRVMHKDKSKRLFYSRGRDGRYNFLSRVHLEKKHLEHFPQFARTLYENEELIDLVSKRFGCRVEPDKLLIEFCTPEPCSDSEPWHIDSMRDQIKVTIPLEDITPGTGGMRYVLGTNHDTPPALRPYLWLAYRNQSPSLEVPAGVVYRLKKKRIEAAGNAGDAIVFDTRGVHARSRILAPRLIAVLSFSFNVVPTKRNKILNRLVQKRLV